MLTFCFVNEYTESLVSLIIGETFEHLDFYDVSSIEDSLSSSNTANDFADDETESSNESEAIQEFADDTFTPRMRGGGNEENIRNCENPSDFGDDILLKLKEKHKGDDKKEQSRIPPDIEASIKLLNMIKTANAPLNLYERIFS